MLAKIAPKFVISRVIQHAYYAEMLSVELLKQPFGTHENYFLTHDASKFYECRFYGWVSSQSPPTEFIDRYEADAYFEALEKFKEFNNVLSLVQGIDEFAEELRFLYNILERQNSSSNIFSHHSTTSPDFEQSVLDALDRYNGFLKELEGFPLWKDKVESEVGRWLHLIHNNLQDSESKKQIFLKMNRQEYFI